MRLTNRHLFKMSAIVVALLAITLFVDNPGFNASARPVDPPVVVCGTCGTCFPTCAVDDSRMMSLSGDGLESFVGGTLLVGFSTPAVPNPSITIGVFDPDSIGGPLAGGKWDDFTANLTFKLFADPTGTGVPALGPPLHEFTSADGFDGQWLDHLYDNTSLTFGSAPLTAIGGNYNFVLQITLDSGADALAINGFKVRTDRSLVLKGQTIQFIAKANRLLERQAIYPGWVSGQQCPTATQIANSTYDGTWEFSFNVPPGTTKLELWDGEFDFGSFDATTTDDNGVAQGDLNTPATGVCAETGGSPMECVDPDIPLWAQGTAADPEGPKGMGNPPDDIDPTFPGCQFLRAPSVTYKLIPPTGPVIFNNNPSGTGEWEKFLVSSVDLEPISDKKVPSPFIEQGLWTFRIEGMDVFNQFSLHFNLTVSPPTGGNAQGCSPGYWKQSQHFGSYPALVLPTDLFTSVGFNNAFPTKSLVQVLSSGGGGLTALGRIITAAYLNAATVNDFPFTPAQIVADFNAVFPGGTTAQYNALKDKYEDLQDPCPFDRNP